MRTCVLLGLSRRAVSHLGQLSSDIVCQCPELVPDAKAAVCLLCTVFEPAQQLVSEGLEALRREHLHTSSQSAVMQDKCRAYVLAAC